MAPAGAAHAADGEGVTSAPEGNGVCTFPMKQQIKERPWALQRVVLDQLWQDTKGRDAHGRPVRVAVIDTGVDNTNPQLSDAVDSKHGWDFLHDTKDSRSGTAGDPKTPTDGTYDPVGHGTKVAGIIAARPRAVPASSGSPPKPRSSPSARTTRRVPAPPPPWPRPSARLSPPMRTSSTSPRTPPSR